MRVWLKQRISSVVFVVVSVGCIGGAMQGYGVIVEKQTAALTRLDAVEKRLDALDVCAARISKLDTKLDLLIELNQQAEKKP